jgi:PPK2 family polyphosphate:nucleotide phosphotransferase
MAGRKDLVGALRIEPGSRVRLDDLDPEQTYGWTKLNAAAELQRGLDNLRDLQGRLWAEGRHRVLIVLQGIDTAGKGGTIEHVMGAFNPQGCTVHAFKVPTPLEMAHDYLWRVHQRVPGSGEITIFDRSHYEDVLIVRVHDLVPKGTWSRRYRQINDFERLLADEGTRVLKFFLWISRDEQRKRLQARLDDPAKRWKFRLADLDERKLWDAYVAAFDDALSRCSTDAAPWFVIPSNKKWFRNLAVAQIVGDMLARLDPQFPPAVDEIPPDLIVE